MKIKHFLSVFSCTGWIFVTDKTYNQVIVVCFIFNTLFFSLSNPAGIFLALFISSGRFCSHVQRMRLTVTLPLMKVAGTADQQCSYGWMHFALWHPERISETTTKKHTLLPFLIKAFQDIFCLLVIFWIDYEIYKVKPDLAWIKHSVMVTFFFLLFFLQQQRKPIEI